MGINLKLRSRPPIPNRAKLHPGRGGLKFACGVHRGSDRHGASDGGSVGPWEAAAASSGSRPGQVTGSLSLSASEPEVRFVTPPKSRTMMATRQLMLPPK
jgi:hypothetical protein